MVQTYLNSLIPKSTCNINPTQPCYQIILVVLKITLQNNILIARIIIPINNKLNLKLNNNISPVNSSINIWNGTFRHLYYSWEHLDHRLGQEKANYCAGFLTC